VCTKPKHACSRKSTRHSWHYFPLRVQFTKRAMVYNTKIRRRSYFRSPRMPLISRYQQGMSRFENGNASTFNFHAFTRTAISLISRSIFAHVTENTLRESRDLPPSRSAKSDSCSSKRRTEHLAMAESRLR